MPSRLKPSTVYWLNQELPDFLAEYGNQSEPPTAFDFALWLEEQTTGAKLNALVDAVELSGLLPPAPYDPEMLLVFTCPACTGTGLQGDDTPCPACRGEGRTDAGQAEQRLSESEIGVPPASHILVRDDDALIAAAEAAFDLLADLVARQALPEQPTLAVMDQLVAALDATRRPLPRLDPAARARIKVNVLQAALGDATDPTQDIFDDDDTVMTDEAWERANAYREYLRDATRPGTPIDFYMGD